MLPNEEAALKYFLIWQPIEKPALLTNDGARTLLGLPISSENIGVTVRPPFS